MNRQFLSSCSPLLRDYIGALNASLDVAVIISVKRFNFFLGTLDCPIIHTVTRKDSDSEDFAILDTSNRIFITPTNIRVDTRQCYL
ncbi:hypothetical protein A8B84_11005 [Marinobacter sp. EhC06]|uniref:hypothetical protein n=1 Tax=Marinobacter TaxID=2742 RepID=UPI0007D9D522|nr:MULTISPECIES: hypothetical protein [unclassified Marinobacter]OAN89737.1 hypothetical protein A8B84_11005 [Marinobacter sp. EhC06]OAN94079.1 hypothetical protein A8B80_16645 [Marinobacter sp. EhN04]